MTSSAPETRRHSWYHEGEVLLLIALVVATYFMRIDALSIRGEESRRATIAQEMLWTGDYVVPRQFGEPFLSRPPLHNWLIAFTATIRGQMDAVAVRLPTMTALLLMTLVVYAYGRNFLGRLGAFTAAAGFATMGEVLQLGRLAECDTLFTFLLGSGVLLWHWGYMRGWPTTLTWGLGYALVALAALTKGPQPPVYFGGTVVLYLAWRRDWRSLFSLGHLFGLAVFAAIVLAWAIPFERACGWEATRRIWGSDSSARFVEWTAPAVLRHMVQYPLECIGCTAPWSLALVAFLSRRFRASLGGATPYAVFLVIYGLVGFLPCWAPPGAATRYVYPLYPAVALLAGLAIDRAVCAEMSPRLRRAWGFGWGACAAGMAGIALAVTVASLSSGVAAAEPWKLPMPLVVGGALGSAIAVTLVWLGRQPVGDKRMRYAVGGLAGFLAVGYALVVVNATQARSVATAEMVARIREVVPADSRIVGIDGTHHLFAYHFGRPVELRSSPQIVFGDHSDVTYFCYESLGDERKPLPFPSEIIAVIPVDRNRQSVPVHVVVVGRRVTGQSALPTGLMPSRIACGESCRP